MPSWDDAGCTRTFAWLPWPFSFRCLLMLRGPLARYGNGEPIPIAAVEPSWLPCASAPAATFAPFVRGRRVLSAVGTAKQVTQGLPPEHGEPASSKVLRPIVEHVAALAPGREVGRRVVRGVVVPVCGGKHHPRRSNGREQLVGTNGETDDPPSPVPPGRSLLVPPPSVTEAEHRPAMGAPTALAPTLGTAEPDHHRQLTPVDRVEEAVLAPDRHDGDRGTGNGEALAYASLSRLSPVGDPPERTTSAEWSAINCTDRSPLPTCAGMATRCQRVATVTLRSWTSPLVWSASFTVNRTEACRAAGARIAHP